MSAVARALRRRRVFVLIAQVLVVLLVLAAWEGLTGDPRKGNALIDEFFTGKPSKILQTLGTWTRSGLIFSAAFVTLKEAVLGFVLGSLGGMLVGFGLGSVRSVAAVFSPIFLALYSVPRLALIPMFILWFGLGLESKVAMVALLVFFLTFFNSYSGAREVDDELIQTTRMMGASRWQILQKVTLPSSIAWVSLGLQISVPHAFTGAVVAEIVAGNEGLGNVISRSSNQFDPNGLFAGIVVVVALSSIMNGVVALGTRYFLRWRVTNDVAVASAGVL